MQRKTRVRFAPSPTGALHIGGVRTALYNYLYARQKGGDFIIRIEDTDSNRFVPGAEQYIIEALDWCGIKADEGIDENGKIVELASEKHPHAPYRQSQRKDIYKKFADILVKKGLAYYAFDSSDELQLAREEAQSKGGTFIYNHSCRNKLKNSLSVSKEECDKLLKERNDWTIRFKMPIDTVVEMEDLIRGHIEVNSSTLDDKVLWKKADELPTYHLANIVDDHLMEITEVIRGEEWLPSLPLHYLLYKAFGWEESMPRFAHLSLLLKPDGKGKLSKRDADKMGFPIFPLKWMSQDGEISRGYREDGYLPEAFVNMLAMLGWNPGDDREIFSLNELIEAFSLDRIIKAGSRFNPDKAKWYNKEYLRMRNSNEIFDLLLPVLESKGIKISTLAQPDFENGLFTKDYVCSVINATKERVSFVSDFWNVAYCLFVAPKNFDNFEELPKAFPSKDVEKFWKEDICNHADEVIKFITQVYSGPWDKENIEKALEDMIKSNEWPMGKVMNCIRLAVTGFASGLGIADIMKHLGKQEVADRMDFAITKIKTLAVKSLNTNK